MLLFCFGFFSAGAQTDPNEIEDSVVREQARMWQQRQAQEFVDINPTIVADPNGNWYLRLEALDSSNRQNVYIDSILPIQITGFSSKTRVIDLGDVRFNNGLAFIPFEEGEYDSFRFEFLDHIGIEKQQSVEASIDEEETHYWTSIIPPLLAILLALLFKEVILSLLLGVFAGALLMLDFNFNNFFVAIGDVADKYVFNAIADGSHVSVIMFSMIIGSMVAVISRNGGMAGVVKVLSKWANSARNTQLATWFLGIAIFFDDYANSLIVGNTMRPISDRNRISREKLAYIVDSTAAPVSAIAFITTWIGAELGYIGDQIATINADPFTANISESAYTIFLNSLQFAFYPILTLVFIFMLIWMRRDFGPMWKAESRAIKEGKLYATKVEDGKEALDEDLEDLDPKPGIKLSWWNAAIPVLTLLTVTFIGLLTTSTGLGVADSFKAFINDPSGVIGNADSYAALVWGSTAGLLSALVLSWGSRTLNMNESIKAVMDGFKTMLPAVIILILAWSLAAVTEDLNTAGFLSSILSDNLNPWFFPAITFILSAVIAFSTGTSWGTMAILYPLVLPVVWGICDTWAMGTSDAMMIFYNTTAVVLAGAVLGDHCSPISDTTVLSSLATQCNHIDHVRTQLPYALTVGAISLFIGGYLFFLGIPFYINFLIGVGLIWVVIRYIGKPLPVHS